MFIQLLLKNTTCKLNFSPYTSRSLWFNKRS